ncbi:hypothetical protein FI667_g15046, partial [Globisporangium splendens]
MYHNCQKSPSPPEQQHYVQRLRRFLAPRTTLFVSLTTGSTSQFGTLYQDTFVQSEQQDFGTNSATPNHMAGLRECAGFLICQTSCSSATARIRRQSLRSPCALFDTHQYTVCLAMRGDGADDDAPLEFALHDLDALLLDLEPPYGNDDGLESALDALAPSAASLERATTAPAGANDVSHDTGNTQPEPFFEQIQLSAVDHAHADAMPSNGIGSPVNAVEPLALATSELPQKSKAGVQNHRRVQTKTTSQKQKEELAYLRTKVAQLEDELSHLKAIKNSYAHGVLGAETESSLTSGDVGDLISHDSAWKSLAERQQKDAVRAKLENEQLREQIEEQIRFAKSLQRMLRKRKIWDELDEQKRHRAINMSDKECDIFEVLSRNVDFSFSRLDQEFEAHGLAGKNTVTSSADVAYNAEEGLHINFLELIIMPFELREVTSLSWQVPAATDMKIQNLILRHKIIEQTENKLVCKATVATKHYDAQSTTVYSVLKRTVEDHQVTLVFESLMKSRGLPWSGNAGIQLVQKGWVKMTQVDAAVHDESVRTTCVQSYVRTTPTMTGRQYSSDTGTLTQFNDAGMLTEAIISSHQYNALAVRQFMENELLDASIKPKQALRN